MSVIHTLVYIRVHVCFISQDIGLLDLSTYRVRALFFVIGNSSTRVLQAGWVIFLFRGKRKQELPFVSETRGQGSTRKSGLALINKKENGAQKRNQK